MLLSLGIGKGSGVELNLTILCCERSKLTTDNFMGSSVSFLVFLKFFTVNTADSRVSARCFSFEMRPRSLEGEGRGLLRASR